MCSDTSEKTDLTGDYFIKQATQIHEAAQKGNSVNTKLEALKFLYTLYVDAKE